MQTFPLAFSWLGGMIPAATAHTATGEYTTAFESGEACGWKATRRSVRAMNLSDKRRIISESEPVLDVVIMLSLESIDDIYKRGFARPPDRLIEALHSEPAVRLMVVAPYRSWPVAMAKRLLRRRERQLPTEAGTTTVQPYRIARKDPTSIVAIERYFKALDRRLEDEVKKRDFIDPIVITFHPMAGFLSAPWARGVTYYARDDWTELPSYAKWHEAYLESYRLIRSRSRNVVAVSRELLDRLKPTAPSLVVPNGIDPGEWRNVAPPPNWFLELPGPRFLYVGTLDERLDLDALTALSIGFPGGSIVLAGPTPQGSPVSSLDLPNITIVDSQDRSAITGLVAAADLCLLTHRKNKLTEAMSPLKLYEYLAGGRPVISPFLRPVQGTHPHVSFYDSYDDVVEVARQSLELGPMTEGQRQEFIMKNSWNSRHRTVLDLAMGDSSQ